MENDGEPSRVSRRWWVRGLIILTMALVAAAIVFGTVQGWDPVHRFWRWLDGFVRTPGFGGFAALTAAAVAYLTAARRIRHDRDVAEAQMHQDRQVEAQRIAHDRSTRIRSQRADRRAAERAQRWEVLMWVYNGATIDPEHLLQVCEELEAEVETSLEKRMLAAVIRYRLDAAERVADDRRQRWR